MKWLIACMFLVSCGAVFSQTNVGGTYNTNQNWSVSGGPYVVTSDVTIPVGVTLSIDPGVTVSFNGGSEIVIEGNVLATGQPGSPITFQGATAQNILHFQNADVSLSHLDHCIFNDGNFAIRLDGNTTTEGLFSDLELNNTTASVFADSGGLRLSHSHFSNCDLRVEKSSLKQGFLRVEHSELQGGDLVGRNSGSAPYALQIVSCTLTDSYCKSEANVGSASLYKNDTLRNCHIRSQSAAVDLSKCFLRDCDFSNLGYPAPNAFTSTVDSSILVNTSIYGDSVAQQSTMQINFSFCLIEREAATTIVLEQGMMYNCSILGAGNGTGIISRVYAPWNTLFWNNAIGCRLDIDGSTVLLQSCNFRGNAVYDVYHDALSGVEAAVCWWGDTSIVAIESKIYDFDDQPAFGNVWINVALPSPDTNTPISPPQNLTYTIGGGFHTYHWDPNPEADLAGYRMYLGGGIDHWAWDQGFSLGNVTTYSLPDSLAGNGVWLTAYDNRMDGADDQVEGHESGFAMTSVAVGLSMHQDEEMDLNVYPNPADNGFSVRLGQFHGPVLLRLYDAQGRCVARQTARSQVTEFAADDWAAGIYLLTVTSQGQRSSRRVVLR